MSTRQNLRTTVFWMTRIQSMKRASRVRAGRCRIVTARHAIIDSLPARAIRHERLTEAIEVMSPRIYPAPRENLQPITQRLIRPDPSGVQMSGTIRRFDVAMDVNRLIHVQQAVVTPAQGVQNMMRVFRAKPRKHDARRARLSVFGFLDVQQFGTVGDIDTAIARLDFRRNEQTTSEDRRLVRSADALRVFENDDLVVGLLPRLDLRIDLARRDPKPPTRIEIHLNRLRQERIGREQIHLKPFGHLERLALDFGIRVRNFGITLSEYGSGNRHRYKSGEGEPMHFISLEAQTGVLPQGYR